MEVGKFGAITDVYELHMKRILEVYMKDGNIAVIPTDDAKVAEILCICQSCLEMVSVLYNKSILQVVDRFNDVIYISNSNIDWDEVVKS